MSEFSLHALAFDVFAVEEHLAEPRKICGVHRVNFAHECTPVYSPRPYRNRQDDLRRKLLLRVQPLPRNEFPPVG